MKCLVAINPKKKESTDYEYLGTVAFGSVHVGFGTIELEQPSFDSEHPDNREYVLLKINAFSCNYRDKGMLLVNYDKLIKSDRLFLPFGSEFSADIVAIGSNVCEFQVGDRVMPNCAYPESGVKGVSPGVATNFASLGWSRMHKKKLIKIPRTLTNIEAACFSLGAQTASSMIRRSGILVNSGNPLVLSARSATSLFITQQLISYGFKPLCLSTTEWSEAEMMKISPAHLEHIDNITASRDILKHKITHVFDPFFDMNIGHALNYLQTGGTYITCGIRDQHPIISSHSAEDTEPLVRSALVQGIMKNVSILGNCLGSTQDLERAINLQTITGQVPIIDREYTVDQGTDFVQHSFFDFKRFGKCVINYES